MTAVPPGIKEAPRPTLEQVALRAGVGRGTASRVINGAPHVSDRTREAVLTAVDELGYVPNQAARSLVTRRTGTVALVISEAEERLFGEPFFAGVVRGISAGVNEASMQLVLALVQNSAQSERLDAYLTPQHVEGVLMLSQHDGDTLPRHLLSRGLPTVYGGRPIGLANARYVDVDNVGGARAAVAHLFERGRHTIAEIRGPGDMIAGRDRHDGYCEELLGRDLRVEDSLVVPGDFSEVSGLLAMRELLRRRPDLDAVFAASDPMAVGALRGLREAGRSVPEDVAVVGFDDSPLAAVAQPALTTVHQPIERLGREMAALLVKGLREATDEPNDQRVLLPTHLVSRDST